MPRAAKRTDVLTLITEVLQLAPKLQLQGDQLTRDLGLTSSRWSFLGFVAAADRPLTIADLARRMDLRPQTVSRFAEALSERGFVTLEKNPDHKRARLIHLTAKGRKILQKLEHRELDWVATVISGMTTADIRVSTRVLARFRDNISRL